MPEIFEKYKSVAILGGTFNPVHTGHIKMAEAALACKKDIEGVVFIPNNIPWYKNKQEIVSNEHRLNMLELALKKIPDCVVSDIELKRGDITYTVDTLKCIKEKYTDIKLYYIIGADSMLSFDTWKDYACILTLCTLLVAPRNDTDKELFLCVEDYKIKYHADIEILHFSKQEISSSSIRKKLSSGTDCRYELDPGVLKYIRENNLYMN